MQMPELGTHIYLLALALLVLAVVQYVLEERKRQAWLERRKRSKIQ